MDSGGLPPDWKPPQPPPIGGLRWKRNVIEDSVGRTHEKNKAFDCGEIGVFCCERTSGGWNYFWVHAENFKTLPEINWEEVIKSTISKAV